MSYKKFSFFFLSYFSFIGTFILLSPLAVPSLFITQRQNLSTNELLEVKSIFLENDDFFQKAQQNVIDM